jgi:phage shock protein A
MPYKLICLNLRFTTKAKSALRQKRKPIALSYIAHRKQLEELITKRLGSLQVLQSTLIRIEASAGDLEVRNYLRLRARQCLSFLIRS